MALARLGLVKRTCKDLHNDQALNLLHFTLILGFKLSMLS